jgi:glucan phosphoethanolaminetransferase (alkaline phosphatase superfamily)
MVDLLEYIKIQWADIHHSRNQDWKVLVIIIGIFYALFKVSPEHIWLHIAITSLGLIACGMGIYMSLIHWLIIYAKRAVIHTCEEELGIKAHFYKAPLPIQGLILLIYFFIASIFCGWLIWLLVGKIWISFITFIVCFLIGFIVCMFAKSKIQEIVERQAPIPVTFGRSRDGNE